MDIRKRGLKQQILIDGAVFSEVADDVVNEGDLVGGEISGLDKICEKLAGGVDI